MWSYKTSHNIITVLMVLLLVAVPLMAQSDDGGAAQGRIDGQRDGKGSAVWILAGCCLSWIGIIIAYLVKPTPPASSMIGKSSDYVAAYTEAYKSEGGKKNAMYAAGGCVASAIVSCISYVVAYGFALPNILGK